MEQPASWTTQLEIAIQAHHEYLEAKRLTRLGELFGLYKTYYENVYNILLRKALIQEDPYKYDQKIAEITAPSTAQFLESEKQEQMTQRLSQFHSQLEFLNDTYQPSVEFLDPERIRRLSSLMQYVRWGAMSRSSESLVTGCVADFVGRIKGGSDSMSTQIVLDAVGQLDQTTREIRGILAEALAHNKERFKLMVRQEILPQVQDPAANDATAQRVKSAFAGSPVARRGVRYYSDLVGEILKEDFSPEGAQARQEALNRLSVMTSKRSRGKRSDEDKELLLQAIRALAVVGREIESCVVKLTANHTLYTERRQTFGERLGGLVRRMAGTKAQSAVYEIEYLDGTTVGSKTEKISIDPFIEDLKKRSRVMAALTLSRSPASVRLRQATVEKMYDFLRRHLSGLQTIHRRLTGLNQFFRTEVSANQRGRVRGLRVELSSIKNAIIKANQLRHEYVSAKEEVEQLRKLGMGETGS